VSYEVTQEIHPPGDYVQFEAELVKMDPAKLAKRLKLSEEGLTRFYTGDMILTTELAERVCKVFGSTLGFWMSIERKWRENVQRNLRPYQAAPN
jgi:plasmid maintenance system antidote protein VapI